MGIKGLAWNLFFMVDHMGGQRKRERKILCLSEIHWNLNKWERRAMRRDELRSVSFALNTRFMWNCEWRHNRELFWSGALCCHRRPSTSQQVSRHSVKLLNWRTNNNLDLLLPSLQKEWKEAILSWVTVSWTLAVRGREKHEGRALVTSKDP